LNNYIQNHWPIRLQNRPADARAFFADHPTAEAKSPGYEVAMQLNLIKRWHCRLSWPCNWPP
jgi:hypothetical protein